jgi:hypothetical protein
VISKRRRRMNRERIEAELDRAWDLLLAAGRFDALEAIAAARDLVRWDDAQPLHDLADDALHPSKADPARNLRRDDPRRRREVIARAERAGRDIAGEV